MILARLLGECWFGHDEPIKVLKGKKLHMVCPKCLADLGVVLPGQRLKKRKEGRVVKFQRERKVG